MKLNLEHNGVTYNVLVSEAKSIAIKLDFEGPQPNHFGTAKAATGVLKLGGFTGDTKLGGSCNVDELKMIPHCNGTHTETVSHIINEDIWIGHAAMEVLAVAGLVTVTPVPATDGSAKSETYRPTLDTKKDAVITRAELARAIATLGDVKKIKPGALIIRTIPNDANKCSRAYNEQNTPAFFTVEAIELINEIGIRHLLVDVPSVDRMYDDGLLTNHHIFWNVEEGSHELSGETWQDKTITEMVFVEDEISDGIFVLNIQVPAFCSDAAPSRPMIMPAKAVKS